MSKGKKTKTAKKTHSDKGRKWLITDWLTDDADMEAGIARWNECLNEKQIRYAVWQVEVAEKGKPHVQAFIHFNRSITMSTLKNRLKSHSIHVEQVKKDEAAAHYCEKPVEGCSCKHCVKAREVQSIAYGPVVIGEKPDYKKGATPKPTDEICRMVKEGYTDTDLLSEAPWALLRHGRGIDRMRFAAMEAKAEAFRQVEVILLTGGAGTGKTAWAIEQSKDGGYFKPDLSKKTIWYDGYQGQRTLILDDFRGNSLKFENLLQVLDGHKLMLPIKGGHTYALWTRVIITSNTIPSNWYQRLDRNQTTEWFDEADDSYKEREIAAFERRITLHVRDIDEQLAFPECVENVQRHVNLAIARKNGAIDARPKKGELRGDDPTTLIGLW